MPTKGQSTAKDSIFSAYDNLLNDKERTCLKSKIQQFSWARAKVYLETHGYPMTEGHYYRVLRAIKKKTQGRLYWFAFQGLETLHLDTLDTLMVVESELWENYWREDDPYKKAMILDKIVQLQPWKSTYSEKTQDVQEKQLHSRKLAMEVAPDSVSAMQTFTKKARKP